MQKYFIIKYDYKLFSKGTIVKFCAVINKCYLVENINNNERMWIMKYDLYPIIDHDNFLEWSYNSDFQKIIPSEYYIIKNNNIIVKLLNNNYNDWIVLNLNDNKEISINKDMLINLNKL